MIRIKLLLLLFSIPSVTFCQKIRKDAYRALQACFADMPYKNQYTYFLSTALLKPDHRHTYFNEYLNTSFFQSQSMEAKLKKGDSLFLETDIAYMKEQMIANSSVRFLNERRLRKQKIAFAEPPPDKNALKTIHILYQAYVPLFSRDGRTALIYLEDVCPDDCGGGSYYILRKRDKKWMILAYVSLWIS